MNRKNIYNTSKSKAYKWSILIPTLRSRESKLSTLLSELHYLSQNKSVQILWFGDNKSMTVGEKRNALLSMSSGDWVSFVDDDDRLDDQYIDLILEVIDSSEGKKVITFYGDQTSDGRKDLPFRYNKKYGVNFKQEIDGQRWKCMIPDHLCVWRRSIIVEKFPDKQLGEDHHWAQEMTKHYEESEQIEIPQTLYYYDFNRAETECRN